MSSLLSRYLNRVKGYSKLDSRPSPIYFLPEDVLFNIFLVIIKDPAYNKRSGVVIPGRAFTRHSKSTIILRLSQVCKKWREISLYYGQLWGSAIEIDFNQLHWGKELIRRAKSSSLVIQSDKGKTSPQDFTQGFWDDIFARVNHWNSFNIRLSTLGDSRPLVEALAHPAHELESFRISNMLRTGQPSEGKKLALPDNLFAGDAPKLRNFSTENVLLSPSFNFSLWKNLTSLAILFNQLHTQDHTSLASSARTWLETLTDMKHLEYLKIGWNDVSDMSAEVKANSPDVHLDHLRVLDLTAQCGRSPLFMVFSKLIIPVACTTSICIQDSETIPQVSFERLMVGVNRIVDNWCALRRPLQLDISNILPNNLPYQYDFEISGIHDSNSHRDKASSKDTEQLPDPRFMRSALRFTCKQPEGGNGDLSNWRQTFPGMLKALSSMPARSEFVALGLHWLILNNQNKALLYDLLLDLKNVVSAVIHVFDYYSVLDILAPNADRPPWQSYLTRREEVILPNLTHLLCVGNYTERLEDIRSMHIDWRNSHGGLPESFKFEVETMEVIWNWRGTNSEELMPQFLFSRF